MDELIKLKEQEDSGPLLLSVSEEKELRDDRGFGVVCIEPQAAEAAHVVPMGESVYRPFLVNSTCHVGHFRLKSDSQRVGYIEPKVGIRNVFALLGIAYKFYAKNSPFFRPEVKYAVDTDRVIEPLVRQFNEDVKRLLQEGLLRRHIELDENLRVLRGQLIFSQQISQNLIHKDRLFCRFAQLEVDVPENQVLLWTLLLLLRSADWSADVKQALQSHILHFGGVSVRQFLPQQFPDFYYDRLSFRYEGIHAWCKLFIDLMSLSDRPGERYFSGYLLDMNALFERFVAAMFERAARTVPAVQVEYHRDHYLDIDRKVSIIPDLILRGPDDANVVVDTKYKRTKEQGRAQHPDLYQIIAYCTALGLVGPERNQAQGILVYPRSEWTDELEGELPIITRKGPSSELTVKVIWLDLDAENLVKETHDRFLKVLEDLSCDVPNG
jgi:5-methylcytosine-specific restriction endonuclease McrBC regulatory subunit McrC